MKNLYIILFLSAIFITSCNKDKPKPEPVTNFEILTQHDWIMKAFTVSPGMDDGNGNIITDLYATLNTCVKTSVNKYTEDYKRKIINGCDPNVYSESIWKFNSDETQIIVTSSGTFIDTFYIDMLTNEKMILLLYENEYTYTETFEPKDLK